MPEGGKKYIAVFVCLLALTAATVSARSLKTGIAVGIALALIIAAVKGALVACHFMHLTNEKRVIYLVLIFTAIFFLVLMFFVYVSHYNVPEGVQFVS